MTVKIIDPHIHLFSRKAGDYHWLKSDNPPFWSDKKIIQRDFTPHDLTLSKGMMLEGFVHIEAGFDNNKPWRELDYIEELASENARTIAAINLVDSPADFKIKLAKVLSYSSLVGVRHILDEQALSILSESNTQANFSQLNEIAHLIFELQLPLAEESSNEVMSLLTKTIADNNQLRFIINHAGFPPRDPHGKQWKLWQKNITALAQYPNVFIKCSGMEMIDRQYSLAWFSDVANFCLLSFSQYRTMLASNFPLCLFSKESYNAYWQDILASNFIKQLDTKEKSALLYHNALRIYQRTNE